MANISDVSVVITATGCARELAEYISLVNKDDSVYELIAQDGVDGVEIGDDNTAEFRGHAQGRWAYINNLEGYLCDGKVKAWLNNDRLYRSFKKLERAICKNDGRVTVRYDEIEGGVGFCGRGVVTLTKFGFRIEDYEELDYTVDEISKLRGWSIDETLDYVYGDEVEKQYNGEGVLTKYRTHGDEDWVTV